MISLSEIGGLYRTIPGNLKDAKTKAFLYACDRQIAKLLECAEKTKVWCALDTVDQEFLDYMAAECRTPFYSSALDTATKRELIASSQHWYMKLGTTKAMNEMLCIVFPGSTTVVEEWFDYGGQPWHFRVKVAVGELPIGFGDLALFRKMLSEIKRGTACLDYLEANVHSWADVLVDVQAGLWLTSGFYPRHNAPYLCYDGTIQYDGTYRYQRYKVGKIMDLYPAALSIRGEMGIQVSSGSVLGLCGIHASQDVAYQQHKVTYTADARLPVLPDRSRLVVHASTKTKTPTYQVQLTIGYHLTKYNGIYCYDGSRRYDSKVMVDTL